jgi:hypothetical protein
MWPLYILDTYETENTIDSFQQWDEENTSRVIILIRN